MNLYDVYETDTALETEGVWVALTKDIQVKVAALPNPNFVDYLTKLQKPYKGQIRKNSLDKEIEEDLYVKAVAKTVLIDWKGIKDKENKDIPYSYENAYKLLSDKSLKRFKSDIILLSTEAETFKAEEKEEAVKNSETSSNGTSVTGTK